MSKLKRVLDTHFKNLVNHVATNGNLDSLNKDDLKETFTNKLEPVIKKIIKNSGQDKLDDFFEEGFLKEEKTFEIRTAFINQMIEDRLALLSSTIDTTFDNFQSIIDSNPENLKAELLDSAINQKDLIETTEETIAENTGLLEAANQSELQMKKRWISEHDTKTRDSHTDAEDRYYDNPIDLDEEFEVGGDSMKFPGEGNDPAENCNCRCTIEFVQMEEEQS